MIPLQRFGTLRTLELLDVAHGRKHAARFVVHVDEVVEHFEAAHSLGLDAMRAPYTLARGDDRPEDYLVRGPGEYTIVAVAKEHPEIVFELEDNHRILGALLGYPHCCIDHFDKSEAQRDAVHTTSAAEHFALAASPIRAAPFWMNTLRRDEHVLLSHLPCSLDCEASDHIGRKRAAMLREADPFWFDTVRSKLSGEHTFGQQRFTFVAHDP